jgi:hypothetical protein
VIAPFTFPKVPCTRNIKVVPVETGPAAKWCACDTPKLKRFGVALAIVTGGRYAASSANPNGTPTVILGLPKTGDSEVFSLFCVKHNPVRSIAGFGLGMYSPSAPTRMLPGLMTSGAVAIENTIGAV